MGFTAYLLRERGIRLSSAATAVGALCKAAAFAAAELLDPAEAPGATAYAARARQLHGQLLSWDSRCPVERPSFTQLSAEGKCAPTRSHRPRHRQTPTPLRTGAKRALSCPAPRRFVALPKVLEKTLPFITKAVEEYHQTPSAALRVRDACVLGERACKQRPPSPCTHTIRGRESCSSYERRLLPPQRRSGLMGHQT